MELGGEFPAESGGENTWNWWAKSTGIRMQEIISFGLRSSRTDSAIREALRAQTGQRDFIAWSPPLLNSTRLEPWADGDAVRKSALPSADIRFRRAQELFRLVT